jgi:hypothetical protein
MKEWPEELQARRAHKVTCQRVSGLVSSRATMELRGILVERGEAEGTGVVRVTRVHSGASASYEVSGDGRRPVWTLQMGTKGAA